MNTRVWKSWFIFQLCKEIPLLFSLFSKLLETWVFSTVFYFSKSGGKTFHFIPINAKLSLLSSKKKRLLLSFQDPPCCRACMGSKKTKIFKNLNIRDRSSRPECSATKVFLKISQNPQENTCARVSFLMKLPEAHNFIYKGDSGTDAVLWILWNF